jgi:hypothetical protein
MAKPLKIVIFCAFSIVAIEYWALAIISEWLTCDDSKAVEVFTQAHPVIGCLAALIWGADVFFGGRYAVLLLLAMAFGLIIRQKQRTSNP